jgi:mycofactocin biosynthesis protein MftB
VTLVSPGAVRAFDPDLPARLHPLVAVRDESFGALAYHYGERRLVFLKTPELVAVLVDLERHESARSAVAAHVAADQVDHYLAALARLFDSGVLDGR